MKKVMISAICFSEELEIFQQYRQLIKTTQIAQVKCGSKMVFNIFLKPTQASMNVE